MGLWVIYGIGIGAAPVIVSNLVTLTIMLLLVALKWRYRRVPAAAAVAALSLRPGGGHPALDRGRTGS